MKLDPSAFSPSLRMAGAKRFRFLLDTLVDLDYSLKNLDSRLLVFHSEPAFELVHLEFQFINLSE
ncbi:DNA photolyase [Artemisia annua]|uniref:DNA photolyase n=1 Tax=Artemisia annua TaxID=35608 RepID=A0A2U1KP45_ARTAN|nr:DNA photolyase [Artemisia annua]